MPNLIRPGGNTPTAPALPVERRPRTRRRYRPPAVALDARRWWPPERGAPLGRRQYAWMAGAPARPPVPPIAAPPRPQQAPGHALVAPWQAPPAPVDADDEGRYRVRPVGDAFEQLDRNLLAFQQLMRRGQPGAAMGPGAPLGNAAMPPIDQALVDVAQWHAGHDPHAGPGGPIHAELQVVQAVRRQIDLDLFEVVQLHQPDVFGPHPLGAGGGIIPQANTGDVHGLHRDRATRHSIARLLTREPRYDAMAQVPRHIAEIMAYLDRHEAQGTHFASPHDPTGARFLARARRALELCATDGFRGILDPANTLVIDALGIDQVPMATVCAVTWDAINRLGAQSMIDAETAAYRLERRDVFVRALASCMTSNNGVVCAPGQAQRLAMVLQGCVPEVLIETYSEVCSVNQFVAYTLEGLNRHVHQSTSDEPERIRRYLDQSYLEGQTVYQGKKLAELEAQLQNFVRLTFDIHDWVPPKA